MKIVIDIDENTYKHLFDNGAEVVAQTGEILLAVKNGIALPKGHGRLIDADKVMYECCGQFDNLRISGETDCNMDCKECDWLELYAKDLYMNVLIEADKEGGRQ